METKIIEEQLDWIRSGQIGCLFATALVPHAKSIGWQFYESPETLQIPDDCHIYSAVFPGRDIHSVREWALNNGFYIEDIEDMYEGLRIKMGENVSWVQYFGPDSHVATRKSPHPMLSFTVKLPALMYAKVGFNGVYHLAHASIANLKEKALDLLWDKSFIKTRKILGHKPTIREAAKTTYVK